MLMRMVLKYLAIAFGLSLVFATPVSAQGAPQATAPAPAPAKAPASPVTLNDGYVLGVGDVVQVSVLGRAEYDVRAQVQTDNTIQLPYIGNISATSKTILQLRDEVRQKLLSGGYYSDPAVNVSVVTYASRYVIVLGEVGSPGIVPIDRAYRMSEIIARAGGSKGGAVDEITLTRANGQIINLSMQAVATSADDADPIVNPGDKVYVAPPKTYYIYGQVASPGNYTIDRGMTLQKAIARSGGLGSLGSIHRITITRDGKEIKKFPLSGVIQDGDVIVIGERFF